MSEFDSVSTTTDGPAASLMSKVSSLETHTSTPSAVGSSTIAPGTSGSHTGTSTQIVEPTKTGVPGVTTPETIQNSPLSGGAKAGIAIGAILVACIAILVAFFIRRRKRYRRRTKAPSDVYEKGIDNPFSKPELVGTIPANSGVPYRKPELEARTKIFLAETSSSEGTTLPYEGGTGAPAEPDREQGKQLVESERLIPHYMEVRESQTGEPSSPFTQTQTGEPSSPSRQREGESSPTRITTTIENLNTLKAQERELAHRMEVSESLLRLRAEHAALLDRIRIAEVREREVHAGG